MRPGLALASLLFLGPAFQAGAVTLGIPFTDHAVLQAGVSVPVWGDARPGERVRVSFAGQAAEATADAQGHWKAVLAPLEPSAVGSDLSVSGSGRVAHDVVVGEVWMVAVPGPLPPAAAAAGAAPGRRADPRVRLMGASSSATWSEGAALTGPDLGYLFGRELAGHLQDPVGIMVVSCNGPVEAWLSPGPQPALSGQVAPLAPYAVRGVVWDGAGANVGRAAQFADRFPVLVQAWRAAFGRQDLPFLWVQLGGCRAGPGVAPGGAAALREAQSEALSLPATGQALTVDLPDRSKYAPGEYREIARRLALVARARVYGSGIDWSGPVIAEARAQGGSMRVRFQHAGDGLTASGGPLRGFEVAGPDGLFHRASAAIEEDSVVVRSPEVPRPVAVRYAWADSPDVNLFNGAGLPAAPFRTK